MQRAHRRSPNPVPSSYGRIVLEPYSDQAKAIGYSAAEWNALNVIDRKAALYSGRAPIQLSDVREISGRNSNSCDWLDKLRKNGVLGTGCSRTLKRTSKSKVKFN